MGDYEASWVLDVVVVFKEASSYWLFFTKSESSIYNNIGIDVGTRLISFVNLFSNPGKLMQFTDWFFSDIS